MALYQDTLLILCEYVNILIKAACSDLNV